MDIDRSKHIKGKLCEAINNLQNFQKSWKKQEVKYLQKKFKKKTAWLFLSHFQPINHASKFKKIHYHLIIQEEIKEKLTVFNVVQISQGLSFRGSDIMTEFNLSIVELCSIFRVEYFRPKYNLIHALQQILDSRLFLKFYCIYVKCRCSSIKLGRRSL